MGKGRLEAFSDGVIAVIITIMVLELKAPHGTDLAALAPIAPALLTYVLSFVYVGIYWNNHHHMLHAAQHIDGRVLWANLHLLFWLSLVPFTTACVGEYPRATIPTAIYGGVFLMAGVAWLLLQDALVKRNGPDSLLARAVGRDRKGKLSALLYASAILMAFLRVWIADALYVLVALIWFGPDRRSGVPVLTIRPGMFRVPGKRERSRFMSGRRAHSSYPRWWVILAIWTAWGLLLSTQVAVYVRLGGKPMPFLTALRLNMPGALVWAIFTPAAIWLARRYPPFEGPHWPRGVAVNLVASAIAVFLEVLLVIVNQRWIRGPIPSDDPLFVAELRNFVWWFPLDGWLYWAIVAGDYGVAHYRRLRERELRASH